jgi:hypothetical protein
MIKPTMLHIMFHQKHHQMQEVIQKTRSHSVIHPVIRSDVPNTQLTTIAKRPPQFGHGISSSFLIN